MSYITIAAGWNASHIAAKYIENGPADSEDPFYDENGFPLINFIDRKGATSLHKFDTEECTNQMETEDEEKENVEVKEEKLCEGVYGWDGEIEIHHQSQSSQYGWGKYWNQRWNRHKSVSKSYLTVLPDLHEAEPPEMTSYSAGYNRISEYRYLDQIEENIRQMAESQGRIEGFLNFGDCFDGFSGVSNKIHEFLNDEYNRKSILFNINAPWSRRSPYRY